MPCCFPLSRNIVRTDQQHSLRAGTTRCLLASLTFLVMAAATSRAQMTEGSPQTLTHLRVSVPVTPQPIPATLFGSFLEPIGHSTYGGLWADVVENPSLEEGLWSAGNLETMLRADPALRRASELGIPVPWHPLNGTQGNRYLVVRGDAGNSNQSLLIMSLPGKEVGISQQVYLPVHRTASYRGSVMLKPVRGKVVVSVSLRRHAHPDQVLASMTVDASNQAWQTYPFALELKQGQVRPLEPVDLVLSLKDDARAEFDNISLFPADAVDGMDPDVLAMARELHSPIVRFGGNFTSAYRWQDGIGPRDKRVSMINPSWGIPEYNTFGTDEFLAFCKHINAEPQVALNLGTGKPEDAADWVRYIDTHWKDGKGGQLWELGNELWGDFQIGYPSQERVGAVTEATSQAIHAVDPHAKLIATGGDEDHFSDWNAEQLKLPAGAYNFLSTHFVVTDHVQLPNSTREFRTMAALALPWGLAPRMHAIADQAKAGGHPDARVAFTEWLMVSDHHDGPHFTNLGGALFAGSFLNMAMRNSDVVSISDMTGILEFGGIWKKREQVYGAPAYWVLRSYASAHPALRLDLKSDSSTYSISQGIVRLPEVKDVPYLDCTASTTADRAKLLLTCVNLDLARPMPAVLALDGFTARGGPARVTTITSDNVLDENDELRPQRVHAVEHNEPFTAGKPFSYTFPNGSVTLIEIPLKPS